MVNTAVSGNQRWGAVRQELIEEIWWSYESREALGRIFLSLVYCFQLMSSREGGCRAYVLPIDVSYDSSLGRKSMEGWSITPLIQPTDAVNNSSLVGRKTIQPFIRLCKVRIIQRLWHKWGKSPSYWFKVNLFATKLSLPSTVYSNDKWEWNESWRLLGIWRISGSAPISFGDLLDGPGILA